MPPSTTDGPPAPTTSHEEAWVAHAALIEAARNATDDEPYHRPIESIERGAPLDDEGVALLRDALVDYLGDAPVRDRAPGRALLRRTDDATGARSPRA
ncbi:hypothetical protein [Halorubrum sp. Atlit-28R]|jgi:hypothetical protein|uniref:DUF7853 family protein n=1 Tax=Halorubrum sp. Atlit-28R TaxID=2282129 RepID=UPI000EF1C627|nr:hypothetical protein [Halorubrum sp. Atlit-28R]RLM49358.1 hypothetical protein DVK06_15420 [Halorubrum sp. Atlit-28R]